MVNGVSTKRSKSIRKITPKEKKEFGKLISGPRGEGKDPSVIKRAKRTGRTVQEVEQEIQLLKEQTGIKSTGTAISRIKTLERGGGQVRVSDGQLVIVTEPETQLIRGTREELKGKIRTKILLGKEGEVRGASELIRAAEARRISQEIAEEDRPADVADVEVEEDEVEHPDFEIDPPAEFRIDEPSPIQKARGFLAQQGIRLPTKEQLGDEFAALRGKLSKRRREIEESKTKERIRGELGIGEFETEIEGLKGLGKEIELEKDVGVIEEKLLEFKEKRKGLKAKEEEIKLKTEEFFETPKFFPTLIKGFKETKGKKLKFKTKEEREQIKFDLEKELGTLGLFSKAETIQISETAKQFKETPIISRAASIVSIYLLARGGRNLLAKAGLSRVAGLGFLGAVALQPKEFTRGLVTRAVTSPELLFAELAGFGKVSKGVKKSIAERGTLLVPRDIKVSIPTVKILKPPIKAIEIAKEPGGVSTILQEAKFTVKATQITTDTPILGKLFPKSFLRDLPDTFINDLIFKRLRPKVKKRVAQRTVGLEGLGKPIPIEKISITLPKKGQRFVDVSFKLREESISLDLTRKQAQFLGQRLSKGEFKLESGTGAEKRGFDLKQLDKSFFFSPIEFVGRIPRAKTRFKGRGFEIIEALQDTTKPFASFSKLDLDLFRLQTAKISPEKVAQKLVKKGRINPPEFISGFLKEKGVLGRILFPTEKFKLKGYKPFIEIEKRPRLEKLSKSLKAGRIPKQLVSRKRILRHELLHFFDKTKPEPLILKQEKQPLLEGTFLRGGRFRIRGTALTKQLREVTLGGTFFRIFGTVGLTKRARIAKPLVSKPTKVTALTIYKPLQIKDIPKAQQTDGSSSTIQSLKTQPGLSPKSIQDIGKTLARGIDLKPPTPRIRDAPITKTISITRPTIQRPGVIQISKDLTKQSQSFRLKPILLSKSGTRQVSKTKTIISPKLIQGLALRTPTTQASRTRIQDITATVPVEKIITKEITKQIPRTELRLRTPPPSTVTVPGVPPFTPPPTFFIPPFLPKGPRFPKIKLPRGRGRILKQFTPSVLAIEFDLRGPFKGLIGGLRTRGLPSLKKRKRRR
ncbi:hypothetical protein CMI37_23005 [Candidatus Pacearchaeota archaeon]|nr:hypothetical protein [Candidatus Pacearchaeota archaeon]